MRVRSAVLAAMALGATPAISLAANDVLYERALMSAAGERCGLFAAPVSAALAAGRAQARNAALRGGADPADLSAVEARARATAQRTACNSADLQQAAERIRSAFQGYAAMMRMNYPGDLADWRADRNDGRAQRWRLAQEVQFGRDRMTFGLAGREGEGVLLAVGVFADGRTPYAARLVMRDPGRSLGPYLDRRGAASLRRLPLAKRMPPSALATFTAEARSTAGADLAGKDVDGAWAFRFPAAAALRLSELDPREAVAVEFLFAGRKDETRRAYVEVGDFAAGRAFLQTARR
ncbi:MAG: hypothetical protein Q8M88_09165 [Phenylobacterium sp.]|uniref:hypothetical protein n=1 Tax=Phenylobacterium sp. TaxID=1871053 RepID=UPI0027360F2E|nr:hypothetical protein [Phenylobacterium sp.]MDP3174587.1 hypothetical protein [Phenylobacterium sp.]